MLVQEEFPMSDTTKQPTLSVPLEYRRMFLGDAWVVCETIGQHIIVARTLNEEYARAFAALPDLLAAAKRMIKNRVSDHVSVAMHPSKRFCHECGCNSKDVIHHREVHAKAEGR